MSRSDTDLPGTVGVIRLVATRELTERLRSKSFFILTGLLVVGILAIGGISRFTGDDGPDALEVGIRGQASEELRNAITATAARVGRDVTVTGVADARAALEDFGFDVVVVVGPRQVLTSGAIDDQVLAIIQQGWATAAIADGLAQLGISPEQAQAVLRPEPLEPVSLDGDDGGELDGLVVLTGTFAAILLFISLQMFGSYVLQGVVEEKSTAVIEVLLVRARPDQLLAGKVLGIGIAALIQFFVAVVAALVSLVISGAEVPSEIWSAVPMTLLWFLTGYAFYSTLFALAGSLVSRQEDAQAASAPILTVLIGAYMLVFVFGYIPDSTASTVMSLIPPIAPLLMPMRMAAGAASVVEVLVALAGLLLSTFLVWKLAGRIFEQVLLRRGSRVSWADALALARRR
ncbi:MAG: ABC transporter permease [Acidimicrobiia bacterium]|nr:ABC transporter permease [Acidimicrobiia bacterium]